MTVIFSNDWKDFELIFQGLENFLRSAGMGKA